MSAPGKYIPPALRKKLAEEARGAGAEEAAPAVARRGVRFPSNAHGNERANVRHHRYRTNGANRSPTRAEKATAESRRLARRTVRAARPARKSTLKGRRSPKRTTRSASPKHKKANQTRAHSR